MRMRAFAPWTAADWLVVLARWPEPGVGKSRLATAVGRQRAYQLAQAFLLDTLGWAQRAPNLLIAYTPQGAESAFRRCAPGARLHRQPAGDLGHRISDALTAAFASGARRAVIIGTDSPNLPASVIDSCCRELDRADVVVTPARDGGFCALGLAMPCAELFSALPWSTPAVSGALTARARALDLRLRATPAWYDIDDGAGLEWLRADLSNDGHHTPHTASVLRKGTTEATREGNTCRSPHR